MGLQKRDLSVVRHINKILESCSETLSAQNVRLSDLEIDSLDSYLGAELARGFLLSYPKREDGKHVKDYKLPLSVEGFVELSQEYMDRCRDVLNELSPKTDIPEFEKEEVYRDYEAISQWIFRHNLEEYADRYQIYMISITRGIRNFEAIRKTRHTYRTHLGRFIPVLNSFDGSMISSHGLLANKRFHQFMVTSLERRLNNLKSTTSLSAMDPGLIFLIRELQQVNRISLISVLRDLFESLGVSNILWWDWNVKTSLQKDAIINSLIQKRRTILKKGGSIYLKFLYPVPLTLR